jgi:hypothetical protein
MLNVWLGVKRERSALAFALAAGLVNGVAFGQESPGRANRISESALRPDRSIAEQLAWMHKNWPNQLGVVIVEAVGNVQSFTESGIVYSAQEFRAVGWMFLRWLADDPQPPGDRFRIHYQLRTEESGEGPEVGDRYIAFLEPAKAQGVFVAEMLLPATEEHIDRVRRAVEESGL